jgi:hypothetical protein
MSVNDFTTAFSQVAIGDPVDCNPIESAVGVILSASSTDAIEAGFGVDYAAGAMPGYKGLIQLPASAAGLFAGIVPRSAIPTPQEAALLGSTAGEIPPGRCFDAFDKGKWRVPVTGNVTTLGQAYLHFSGANAGEWGPSDGGTQPVYLLAITSTGADTIGFTGTIGAVAGVSLSVSSVSAAADSAALAAAWNANAYYAA